MDLGLKDRVAVVTGGSAGIGRATVARLLDEDCRVAFFSRNAERVDTALAELRGRHDDRVWAAACDARDGDGLASFADEVHRRLGNVDVLVANAGEGRRGTFAETDDAAWREELDLKFFSVIRPVRAFMPDLTASDCGAIVCVNSLLAHQPEPQLAAMSAARGGVQALLKALSIEAAEAGVRVNSILLGTIGTEMWQVWYREQAAPGQSFEDWQAEVSRRRGALLGRLGKPEEVAAAIAFLSSPLAGYITGASLDVSGGAGRYA